MASLPTTPPALSPISFKQFPEISSENINNDYDTDDLDIISIEARDTDSMGDIENRLNDIQLINSDNNNVLDEKYILGKYSKITEELNDIKKLICIYKNDMNTFINEIKMLHENHRMEIYDNIKKIMINSRNISNPTTTTIDNNVDDMKYKKIKFNENNEKILVKPLKEYLNVIMNGNTTNFGKIVGKNGHNLKSLQEKFNVIIIVPNVEYSKLFPYILIWNCDSYNDYNFNKATEHIVSMLL